MKQSNSFLTRLLFGASIVLSLAWAATSWAGKPPGGSDCGGGTLYFFVQGNCGGCPDPYPFAQMNCDGTAKVNLPAPALGEPSHMLHGGHRWFLTGTTAVRDDNAVSVPMAGTRWALTNDNAVSYESAGGIVVADVVFNAAGTPAVVPGSEVVVVSGNIGTHDWSPDGTKAVFHYNSGAAGLWVADLTAAGGPTQIVSNSTAWVPRWSPAGTRIVFGMSSSGTYPDFDIATVSPDGSNLKVVVNATGGALPTWYGYPSWSPTGSHLIFQRRKYSLQVGEFFDVMRSTASGNGLTSLTDDVPAPKRAAPIGWR